MAARQWNGVERRRRERDCATCLLARWRHDSVGLVPACGMSQVGKTCGRPLQPGEHLFRMEDPLEAIYQLHSGALKSYVVTPDGRETVIGFHLPGEIVGLKGIGHGAHPCSAVALETTRVCAMPYGRLVASARELPDLPKELFRVLSGSIQADWVRWTALFKARADKRLASALVDLSMRMARCSRDPFRFDLPMTHQDLAAYLGLARETVSRVFGRFQSLGWVSLGRREVTLNDWGKLRELAGRRSREVGAGLTREMTGG